MSDDFDLFRARVEEQLRADVELLIDAARTKVRAYETVLRARGELDERQILTTELFLPAAASLRLPAGTAAADVATVPAAVPTAVEPGPEPARAVDPLPPATEVYAEVLQAVDQLGETFGRADIGRVLPFELSRANFYRVLETLLLRGLLIQVEPARGRRPARYRKAAPPPAGS